MKNGKFLEPAARTQASFFKSIEQNGLWSTASAVSDAACRRTLPVNVAIPPHADKIVSLAS